MHYANGRAAKIGDLVRGKGYNLKHEFTGVLLFANPDAPACNCQVATVTAPGSWEKGRAYGSYFSGMMRPNDEGNGWDPTSEIPTIVHPYIEYGQLDAFVAINPSTGDVLPPDEPQPAAPALEPVAIAQAEPTPAQTPIVEQPTQGNQAEAQPQPQCNYPEGYEIAGGRPQTTSDQH